MTKPQMKPGSPRHERSEATAALWEKDASQARALVDVAELNAQKPWGEYYKRFIAAEVATGRRSKDHPEATGVMNIMGRSFEELQGEILRTRKLCGIPNELKPELAELYAMMGLANEQHGRDRKAALEDLRDALKAAVGASRKVDGFSGGDPRICSRAVAAQLFEIEMELSVFPEREEKSPQLAATPEAARKARAKRVGVQLAILGVPRREAARYLTARNYEKEGTTISAALEYQGKREKVAMSVLQCLKINPER